MDPLLGEIRMFASNFAPVGWALCDGSLLPIASNESLYALLGTIFGGDGQNTFALPDLRGRVPVHRGQGPGLPNIAYGTVAGANAVQLTPNHWPAHTHTVTLSADAGTLNKPTQSVPAGTTGVKLYRESDPDVTAHAAAIGKSVRAISGASAPYGADVAAAHQNMQPYLAVHFIICTSGNFPPQP